QNYTDGEVNLLASGRFKTSGKSANSGFIPRGTFYWCQRICYDLAPEIWRRCMRHFAVLAVLAVAGLPAFVVAAPQAVDGNLYFLGVAIDAFPGKGGSNKDYDWMVQYVEKALKGNSSALYHQVESKLLLDQGATHDGILD